MAVASFAEVLEAALGAVTTPAPPGGWTPPRWSPPATRLEGPGVTPFAWTPYAHESGSGATRPVRPPRHLTARQRHALRALVALGGALTDDFTPCELRSAFRLLARLYHPDRHPQATDAERARLSGLFADLVAHHHTLTDTASPASPRSH